MLDIKGSTIGFYATPDGHEIIQTKQGVRRQSIVVPFGQINLFQKALSDYINRTPEARQENA